LIANPRALQAIFHGLSVQALQSASCKCIREVLARSLAACAEFDVMLIGCDRSIDRSIG